MVTAPEGPLHFTQRKGGGVTDISDRFMEALEKLEEVVDGATPDEALGSFDEATLQVFWREWPHFSSWMGGLWRRLNDQLAEPAIAQRDPDLDEVGGSE